MARSNLRAASAGSSFDGNRSAKGAATRRSTHDSNFESGFWRAVTWLTLLHLKSDALAAHQKKFATSMHQYLRNVVHRVSVL